MVYVVLTLVFINVTFIYFVGSCMNSLHTAPLTKLMCVWAGIVLRNSIHNTIQDMMSVCHQWAMVDWYIVVDFLWVGEMWLFVVVKNRSILSILSTGPQLGKHVCFSWGQSIKMFYLCLFYLYLKRFDLLEQCTRILGWHVRHMKFFVVVWNLSNMASWSGFMRRACLENVHVLNWGNTIS